MPTIAATSRPAYVYDSQTDQWVPIGIGPHTHPNYIDQTLIDAKGDMLVGTAADTSGRLAVGTNGQVLVVDSTTNTGLAWTDISITGNIDGGTPTSNYGGITAIDAGGVS